MDTYKALTRLEKTVESSKPLPLILAAYSVINKENFLKLIAEARANLPEEILQAKDLVSRSEQIKEEAAQNAEKIVSEAEDRARETLRAAKTEAGSLIQQHEIVRQAREEAEHIIQEAEERAQAIEESASAAAEKINREANDYARGVCDDADRYVAKGFANLQRECKQILDSLQRMEKK